MTFVICKFCLHQVCLLFLFPFTYTWMFYSFQSMFSFLVLNQMDTTIRSQCWFEFVTFTEVNHFLCSSLFVEESSNVFSCYGYAVFTLMTAPRWGRPTWCLFIRNSGFTRNFHSPLESTWVATNLPWETSKLSVCTVSLFLWWQLVIIKVFL